MFDVGRPEGGGRLTADFRELPPFIDRRLEDRAFILDMRERMKGTPFAMDHLHSRSHEDWHFAELYFPNKALATRALNAFAHLAALCLREREQKDPSGRKPGEPF